MYTIINSFYIYRHYLIEIFFFGVICLAYMSNSSIIDKDIYGADIFKYCKNLVLICNIAFLYKDFTILFFDLIGSFICTVSIPFKNMNDGALLCKKFCNGFSNTTTTTGDHRNFIIKTKHLFVLFYNLSMQTMLLQ